MIKLFPKRKRFKQKAIKAVEQAKWDKECDFHSNDNEFTLGEIFGLKLALEILYDLK